MLSNDILLSLASTLLMALGAVLWFFFQRAQQKLDRISHDILDMTKEYKTEIHSMENRLADKLDMLEKEHHRTREDMSKLFTRVGTLEGFVHGVHKEFPKSKLEEHSNDDV